MARQFATQIGAIRVNRFARTDSQKKPYLHDVRAIRIVRIASNLQFAIFCPPKRDSQKRGSILGHTPSTAGTFRKKFRKNSGKTPETLSERFLELPSRVRLGRPKPYNSRHLRLPGRFFFQKWFRRGPLRAGHGIPGSTEGISEIWEP